MQMPPVTQNLILINALCWLASLVLPRFGIDLIELGGLHFPGTHTFHWFQPLTYMFLHDTRSIGHLFFNMFAVFMFGRVLEMTWGPRRFLFYYLATGVGAALVQELTWLYTVSSYAAGNGLSIMQQVALDPGVSMLSSACCWPSECSSQTHRSTSCSYRSPSKPNTSWSSTA